MANYPNGSRGGRDIAVPDENRPTWRPDDQRARARGSDDDRDDLSWRDRHRDDEDRYAGERDPRRWEGSRGSELGYRDGERYGQGQSGYSAGRGDDRAHNQRLQGRNEMVPSYGDEDRDRDGLGVDDRWSGRGRSGAMERGYDPERHGARGFESRGGWRSATGRDEGDDRSGAYGRSDWQNRGGSYGGGSYGRGDWHYRGGGSSGGGPYGGGPYGRGDWQDPRGQGYGDRSYGHGPRDEGTNFGGPGYEGSAYGREREGRFRGTQDTRRHLHGGAGPHRGKGPAGFQRTDERIREMVCEALADDDQIDASQIHVTVKDGEVTLSGMVDDRATRREAEDCASSVSGVRDVQLQLRIRDEQRGRESAGRGPSSQGAGAMHTASATAATSSGKQDIKADDAQDKKHRA